MERAHQVLERSSYVGACPVPIGRYIETLKILTANKPSVFRDTVENALRGMIISEDLTNCVGAAVNAGKSLFLFGAPGNGKTLLAERIATMLGGAIAIPYAIEADGRSSSCSTSTATVRLFRRAQAIWTRPRPS